MIYLRIMIVNNIIVVSERFFDSEEVLRFELKKKEIIVHYKTISRKTTLRFNREKDAQSAFLSIPEEYKK